MDYLKFVEDYKTQLDINLFEKVLVACSRAKDIYKGKRPLVDFPEEHKPTAIAFYEVSNQLIEPTITMHDLSSSISPNVDDSEEEESGY